MSAVGGLIFCSLFVMSTTNTPDGRYHPVGDLLPVPLLVRGRNQEGGETDVLLTDKPMIACIVVWAGFCVYALRP